MCHLSVCEDGVIHFCPQIGNTLRRHKERSVSWTTGVELAAVWQVIHMLDGRVFKDPKTQKKVASAFRVTQLASTIENSSWVSRKQYPNVYFWTCVMGRWEKILPSTGTSCSSDEVDGVLQMHLSLHAPCVIRSYIPVPTTYSIDVDTKATTLYGFELTKRKEDTTAFQTYRYHNDPVCYDTWPEVHYSFKRESIVNAVGNITLNEVKYIHSIPCQDRMFLSLGRESEGREMIRISSLLRKADTYYQRSWDLPIEWDNLYNYFSRFRPVVGAAVMEAKCISMGGRGGNLRLIHEGKEGNYFQSNKNRVCVLRTRFHHPCHVISS